MRALPANRPGGCAAGGHFGLEENGATFQPFAMSLRENMPAASPRFQTTRWTTVLAARNQAEEGGQQAMALLCRAYWYPLYAFVRRNGRTPEDAQDLTQAFFARLLEKDFLLRVAPEKGRFRTFLLMALKRFLANEWHKSQAAKRGGKALHFSIDAEEAEERYAAEPVDNFSPERLYERRWAYTLLDQTMNRLRSEYRESGREEAFEHLKEFLTAADESSFARLAPLIGRSEGSARVAVHRMRGRFRELFRQELAETVTPEKVEEELRHLRTILME
jgi:DNA-directed RNA polymerase specialized sigma24 family protein